MPRSNLAIAFTLVGTVLATAAQALGLGAIEAKSALNQPLDARISLISADSAELDSLAVALASGSAFQRAGVDRPFHLSRLVFEVVQGDRPHIRVTTKEAVKEPFLDFLVEANWPRGRLVREYTLLLDPPVYAPEGGVAAIAAASASASAPAARASATDQGRATATPAVAVRAPTTIATQADGGPRQYAVQPNDTLWQIANDAKADPDLSVNQMMVAVLRANPQAFIDGDMNRLKRGAVLRLPEPSVVDDVDAATANAVVRRQSARWRQEQVPAALADRTPPAAQGQLKVVAPSEAGGVQTAALGDGDLPSTSAIVSKLQRELTLSEEAAASLRAENEELKAQIDALQQQSAAPERLIDLPSDQMMPGQMQAEAAEQSSTEAMSQAAAPAAEAMAAQESEPEPAMSQPAAEAPVMAETPAASEPAQAPGFFSDPKNLGILGGVGLLLAALVYLLFRRRRQADDAVEMDLVVPAELPPEEETAVAAEVADEEEQAAPQAQQDMPPENDALGEAEVYLAYGRYDQAEDVVGKALEQSPDRSDLRLKLMEILALTQNPEGFEAQARALREQVGGSDPAWLRAAEMGREFIPESDLFAQSADAPVEAPASDADFGDFSFDELDAQDAAPTQAADPQSLDFPAADDEAKPDFDLDAVEEAADDAPAEAALDFSLDEEPGDADVEDVAVETAEAATDEGLDFQIDEVPSVADAEVSESGLEFTLPEEESDPAGADEAESLAADVLDEVGTKLDLARAYLDMGDGDGARGLLDEVLSEGSANQKGEAEDLLRQIA